MTTQLRPQERWPCRMIREHDLAELTADKLVHITGIVLGLAGAAWLAIRIPSLSGSGERLAFAVYAFGLLAMLSASAAYHLWPRTPVKGWLRRIDHSAIYVLIAGTYSPFIAQIQDGWTPAILLAFVWTTALVGLLLKLFMPHRLDGLSTILYLALGWSGVAAYDAMISALDPGTLWLLAIGGIIYSTGVIFHLCESLRFQNAIWHLFVLVAAAVHYVAVIGLTFG
jgi:hemolysin III